MKKKLFTIACNFILSCAPAFAQSPFEPLFGPVVLNNLAYGKALDYNNREVELTLDLYMPAVGRQSRFPLLILVHGGGFIAGNRVEMQGIANYFATQGYVVANVSYRLGFINIRTDKTCNGFPAYACGFAADSAEWVRAWYRGVQDIKGAIRYLVNRAEIFKINPEQVFLLGESAGGFIVYGAAFLDTDEEKPVFANKLPALPVPEGSLRSKCSHYSGQTFSSDSIQRPDLGSIEGDIEWPGQPYTIRGVANLYGGMFFDLLERKPTGKYKSAIYQFHRACDIVVPYEYNRIYFGFSWCVANCWGCEYIFNTPHVFGSKRISDWNQQKGYGHNFRNDFSVLPVPYVCIDLPPFIVVPHNCAAQINEPCHSTQVGFDIRRVKEFFHQQFFAPEGISDRAAEDAHWAEAIVLGPNPFSEALYVQNNTSLEVRYWVVDVQGRIFLEGIALAGEQTTTPAHTWPRGVYFLRVQELQSGRCRISKVIKSE
ncbi:MAG: carboxylesterase family protein [Saprospiraceae bacterium]|nr:carboxylesterase family protein [Saprospiraceae bacterium]MDW8230358.1 carboxylesterase family protein [Saprospiraceae bacterium]